MSQFQSEFESSQVEWAKVDGLVPAIIQHAETAEVLMLGYMNEESLAKTLESGKVVFFSRSRKELWTKGETSGNFLNLKEIAIDCDGDTLLVQAIPTGPVCHQGTETCFGDKPNAGFLKQLESIIQSRRSADPSESYTARMLNGPVSKVAQKVGEEGVEVALAAVDPSNVNLLNESADLVYHLLVLIAHRGLSLNEVIQTLAGRHVQQSLKKP